MTRNLIFHGICKRQMAGNGRMSIEKSDTKFKLPEMTHVSYLKLQCLKINVSHPLCFGGRFQ